MFNNFFQRIDNARKIIVRGEFHPLYNRRVALSGCVPEIYNKNGERMDIFFVSDRHFVHEYNRFSQRFLWDRYNYGLKTHFYTHDKILEPVGTPDKKYGWLLESEAICPKDYLIFEKNKGLEKDFDFIFTFSEKILDKYENARFAPGNGVWYGKESGGGELRADGESLKSKNISIMSSDKSMCELHDVRKNLAKKLKKTGNVDTFGNFDGGARLKNISDTLTEYRYSIAFENDITPLYFTEKILNCFAAMTVPIYIGATEIGKFFNTDGIIQISLAELDNIEKILRQCSERDYFERLSAIKDNYERVQKFLVLEDYIFENHIKSHDKKYGDNAN